MGTFRKSNVTSTIKSYKNDQRRITISISLENKSPSFLKEPSNISVQLSFLPQQIIDLSRWNMTTILRRWPQLWSFSHNALRKVTSHGSRWRIWAGHHADAPVARTCGLLQAEEDHRSQLRKRHHQCAEVIADIITWPHLLNDVIPVDGVIVLTQPSSHLTHGQWSGTLLWGHRDAVATWRRRKCDVNIVTYREQNIENKLHLGKCSIPSFPYAPVFPIH